MPRSDPIITVLPWVEFIEVDRLTKAFPTALGVIPWARNFGRVARRTALDGVCFGVRQGELFGLLGTNGAGKSTILRILSGLIVPDGGTVIVAGIDASSAPVALRRKVGLCNTDERSFYHRITARRNLEYFGALQGLAGAPLRERIVQVMTAVDLKDVLDLRFDSFSSGMKQRLGIARALLADPDVLILDEPTRAVDPAHAASIRAFVRDELVGRRAQDRVARHQRARGGVGALRPDRRVASRQGRSGSALRANSIFASAHRSTTKSRSIARTTRFSRACVAFPDSSDVRFAAGGESPVRLIASLQQEPKAFTELLRAVSANGVCVSAIRQLERRPADIFADLISGTNDVR